MGQKYTDDELLAEVAKPGGIRLAAERLGLNRRTIQRRLRSIEPSRQRTVFPIVPDGHVLKGVSSLQKVELENGQTVMQWVKTREDQSAQDLNAALEALKSELPRVQPIASPNVPADNLAALFTITDFHMGMYSWAEETGEAWDMQIAEDLLVSWFGLALDRCGPAACGILAQLGDFLHYDSLEAVTPTSRNQLDADSRAQKMIRVSIRVLRRVIDMMLAKYPEVIVLMAEGNHDIVSSAWLREAFKVIYENEPRVTVVTSPDPYYAVQWGRTGLFFHHGHLKKPEQLDRVFARKFREVYGACTHAYGHSGHMHHKLVLESALMHLEQHPTLAASDAHASRHGYMSDRAATVIVYDKELGEVGRVSVSPEMVKALSAA